MRDEENGMHRNKLLNKTIYLSHYCKCYSSNYREFLLLYPNFQLALFSEMTVESFCQHCGTKNKSVDTLCVSCKQPLFVVCSNCRHANPSVLNYCFKCGTVLPKKTAKTFSAEAERRYLNVMFCDLVGSTALSEKLDPEELREVVVAYQDVCAEAIEEMGGTIAQYLGDGILVYFGYPVAYEDGSQRAVKAALKIIGNMGSLNEKLKSKNQSEVSVRIGIHTGLAVIGEIGRGEKRERLALGDTPNIAARIQGLAEPGTVVISADTYKLVQKFFHCEPRGTHLLKGISTPMTIYQPLNQQASSANNFIDERGTASPLIGREEVMKQLMDVWELSLNNSEEIVLVSGEAGMGKTHLIHEFVSQTQSENPIVISGKCFSLFQNNSFYPVTDILLRLAEIDSRESDAEKLLKLENFLNQNDFDPATVIPVLAVIHSIPFKEKYEPLTLGTALMKQKAFQQLKDLLIGLSKKSPVIFLLEDIQWADPSTLEFLQFLIKKKESHRILYLFSFRPEFSMGSATHSSSWINEEQLHRFEIAALNESQVKMFAGYLAG